LLYAGPACTAILPSMLPCVAGVTGMCHCAQSLVNMSFLELFAQAGLEP
jgi:hypothetical protein